MEPIRRLILGVRIIKHVTTREQIFQEIKRDGVEITKSHAINMNPRKRAEYEKVIQEFESSEILTRQETREEESLSISRKALTVSERANEIAEIAFESSRLATSIAISAIILSIIMAIKEIIEWYAS